MTRLTTKAEFVAFIEQQTGCSSSVAASVFSHICNELFHLEALDVLANREGCSYEDARYLLRVLCPVLNEFVFPRPPQLVPLPTTHAPRTVAPEPAPEPASFPDRASKITKPVFKSAKRKAAAWEEFRASLTSKEQQP